MQVPTEHVVTKADSLAIEQGCYWDAEQANRIVRFVETYVCPQTTGQKLTLLPWQRSFLSRLYGWRDQHGRRRFRTAILSTAKKNGKTLLTSALALYELFGQQAESPLVVSASTTSTNTKQIFDNLLYSINRNKKLKALTEAVPSWNSLRVPSRNGRYRGLSSDAGNAEGLDASCVLMDENHAWRSDKLYRSLQYATVARHGLTVMISTAGSDQGHFWYALDRKARAILSGDDLDTSTLPLIFSAEPDDPLDSPQTWAKANPSLGTSFSLEDFAKDYEEANKTKADLLSFRRYRLNSWVAGDDAWLSLEDWDKGKAAVTEEQLRNAPLFVGCDLSQTTDISAVVCCWYLGDRKFYIRPHGWVCEEGAKRRNVTNLPAYEQYRRDGSLTITEGDAADYPQIRQFIEKLSKVYKVKSVCFDMWNAIEMAAELMSRGVNCVRMPQNYASYTWACKQFEGALKDGRILHNGSSLLRWQVQNCVLSVDAQGNCMPSRKRSRDKIDNVIASVMAFSQALPLAADVTKKPSVYATRAPIRI